MSNLPLPLPFTSYVTSIISSTLSSTSKISSIVSLTIIPILIAIILTVFESLISLDIVKLSTTSTSVKSSSPSWRGYLWFPRFTRFTLKSAEVILLNLTCKAFMSWQILLTSATVGLTRLFSICCPMENTLGSPAALAVPGTASLIFGFEKSSIKKVFKSFSFLYVMQIPYTSLGSTLFTAITCASSL